MTPGPLRAPHTVAFSYERSVGGATEQFLRGLAAGEVWGSHASDGRIVVPPVDHDPVTGAATDEFVRVGDAGVVRTWTWVADPRREHPLPTPFAFALIQLDGADTALLHVVDVDQPSAMATGMRVRADWRATRVGSIGDIRAFVPDRRDAAPVNQCDPPTSITVSTEVRLQYTFEPGLTLSAFFGSLAKRRIEGGRCSSCAMVFVPPHGRCPVCGNGPMEVIPVGDTGTVVSYAVVHLPVHGLDLDLPFAWAWIRLDGADVPFAHLLGEVAPGDVSVGQRVEAVWVADDERPSTWEAIGYFRPAVA